MAKKRPAGLSGVELILLLVGALLCIILAVIFGAIVLIVSPGMLIMSILKAKFAIGLDYGQMWTFSIVMSVAIYIACWFKTKSASTATVIYTVLCAILAVFFLIAHFGFKAQFPTTFLDYFFSHKTTL
jgi:hypothetical protein